MPQRFPCSRKIRFTLRFRQPITIAARFAFSRAQIRCAAAARSTAGYTALADRPRNTSVVVRWRTATDRASHEKSPAAMAVDDANSDVTGNERAGHVPGGVGTRASANTSGPDLGQDLGVNLGPGEIAEPVDPHRTKKLVSSAGPLFENENSIQPFDLMSRRHPLSSTGAVRSNRVKQIAEAQVTCRR